MQLRAPGGSTTVASNFLQTTPPQYQHPLWHGEQTHVPALVLRIIALALITP